MCRNKNLLCVIIYTITRIRRFFIMGLFGNNGCGNNDQWLWIIIIAAIVLCCGSGGGILGGGNNCCCEHDPCNPCC